MSRLSLSLVANDVLRRFQALLLLCLPVSSALADTVVIRDDDPQVKKLVAVYERFREAALKDDEVTARRLLAGYSAGSIDNCLKEYRCAKANGGSFTGMLRQQIKNGFYPDLKGSVPWVFDGGHYDAQTARLRWTSQENWGQMRSTGSFAVDFVWVDKGWRVLSSGGVSRVGM
ncbi:hypothetical protein EV700_0932 [Fluviicoccus keumensis]|uniref:Nuclear transport factor 2 family protein n=1 Tax=Fluviicoccus keumensis TaxID=1435465 RepID=A0A4Q7ZD48_9GAMM|nr:hypothetical protein [Fluviicoccus keumensis]RZU47963.1 hypothetical protein EV700_0932 [Fluviicoccus keumensis]